MPIRFACAQCGARVKTPDGSVGKKMKCPRCGHLQRVPEKGSEVAAASPEPPGPAPEAESPPEEADALAALAEAAADDGGGGSGQSAAASDAGASDAAGPFHEAPEAEQEAEVEAGAPEPAAEPPPALSPELPTKPGARPRPKPQPRATGRPQAQAEAPRSIPLSAQRPRPTPKPDAGGGSAAKPTGHDSSPSGQVLSGGVSPIVSDPRSRSINTTDELPRARTTQEIRQSSTMLNVIAWLCRALAILIAAGAIELMLHAGRQGASLVTRLILLVSGLAVAAVAVAVGQLAASMRQPGKSR